MPVDVLTETVSSSECDHSSECEQMNGELESLQPFALAPRSGERVRVRGRPLRRDGRDHHWNGSRQPGRPRGGI